MRYLKWLPPLLWAAIILSASTDTFSSDATGGWLTAVAGERVPEAVNNIVRKGGHVAGYAVLSMLAWFASRRFLPSIVFAALVAVLDETRQGFSRLREGSPWDVLLDTSSAALTLLLFIQWRQRKHAARMVARPATSRAE
jgi:VanZ family protein